MFIHDREARERAVMPLGAHTRLGTTLAVMSPTSELMINLGRLQGRHSCLSRPVRRSPPIGCLSGDPTLSLRSVTTV
jgi:hypothetical protein